MANDFMYGVPPRHTHGENRVKILEFDKYNTQNAILNKLYKTWIIITMICVILTWCLFKFAQYEYSLSYSTFFCKYVLVPVICQNPAEKL